MGFNNFASLHTNLLPPQGDWAAYGGGYATQDASQAYMSAQPASYANFSHQNPYTSYAAATMFGAGSPTSSSSGGGGSAGVASGAGVDPLGNASSAAAAAAAQFYATSAAAIAASTGVGVEPQMVNPHSHDHHHGSPTCGYKIDFNNIVDEKILSDPTHSGNESESPTIKNQ